MRKSLHSRADYVVNNGIEICSLIWSEFNIRPGKRRTTFLVRSDRGVTQRHNLDMIDTRLGCYARGSEEKEKKK
jgi:hypothetical protein